MKRVLIYPIDYVRGLKNSGNRKKAMAFLDYWDDFEVGEFGSERFYAKNWNIGNATAHRWIKEFDYEIDLFINHWKLKNQQHYNKILYDEQVQDEAQGKYVKIQMERMEQLERSSWSSQEPPKNRDFKTSNEAKSKTQVNEVFNNTTTTSDHLTDQNFNELLFVYRCNGGNSQNTAETYEAYKRSLQEIKDVKLLKVAIIKYLQDSKLENKVWFKRFLEEKIYQKYLKPHYKLITLDGKEIFGAYDEEVEKFYTDDKKAFPIDKSKFYELIAEDRLLIEGYTL